MKTPFLAPISEQIWDAKYRFRDAEGKVLDKTLNDTFKRISTALATNEKKKLVSKYTQEFYNILDGFKFLPAGRIISGAGTKRNVTLFNCFVMGTIPDSLDGIFSALKEAAMTMQQGGGIGYDFSTLRPKGALVKKLGADASGPLSFMDCWDAMCRTIMSAGARRGAMMATMRCDHPDIRDFITAKQDAARLRMFNLSVLVTDAFMEAVDNNDPWDLVFEGKVHETVQARDLWNLIMQSTYDSAEPGVIFIDRINEENNLRYCETIASTNPCGEQPLPPYGACLLGSINMATMVQNAFTKTAYIDWDILRKTVNTAVRMMDNVIDVSNFPLKAQQEEALNKRRIGLGVTGIADMLIMLRQTYGSFESATTVESVMKEIALTAYWASVELAKEKGPFPLFDAEGYLAEGTFAHKLCTQFPDLGDAIRKHGIRNSHLTSIAPTGTISLFAGNVSSGIEPVFAYEYTRKVLNKDGTRREEKVEDRAVQLYRDYIEKTNPGTVIEFPDYFVSAQTLPPEDHLRMQAAAQKWVDSSISKTINLPEDISFDAFKEVYEEAYRFGCKGCTTYRPNEVTGSVLSVEPKKEEKPQPKAETKPMIEEVNDQPTKRPPLLDGATYKIKYGMDSVYITITNIVENSVVRPFEVFINSKNVEHYAWTVGMARMLSAIFRRPQNSAFVVQELKEVFDPKGGHFMEGKYVPSLLAALGNVIEKHMQRIGYIEGKVADKSLPLLGLVEGEQPAAQPVRPPKACENCGAFEVKTESGCGTCLSCGHSKCG